MFDPVPRDQTSSKITDVGPCGGLNKGPSHSLIDPGTLHPVSWKVIYSSVNSNCTVRLLQNDNSYLTLDIRGVKNEAGWFPCARKETNYENVVALIPESPGCVDCTIQFICKTYQGTFYQCSDISIGELSSQNCIGKCKNGGVCQGNMCKCKENYYGNYCESKIKVSSESHVGTFFIFLILLVLASVLVSVAFFWKNPDKLPAPAASLISRFTSKFSDESS